MMVIEGIVTSCDPGGHANIAMMGALIEEPPDARPDMARAFTLRPYQSSQTYRNLMHGRCGVFHVVDDAELIAQIVVGDSSPARRLVYEGELPVPIVADTCRWYAFTVSETNVVQRRARMQCRVTAQKRVRDCAGLNRATFAVLEAAILATRIDYQDLTRWRERLMPLRSLVEKTGGPRQRRAFDLLHAFFEQKVDLS